MMLTTVFAGCGNGAGAPHDENDRSTAGTDGHSTSSPSDSASATDHNPAEAHADPSGVVSKLPISERRYAGYMLVEWQRRVKDLDADDPSSADAVAGLTDIVRDADLPWHARKQAAMTLARIGAPAAEAVPVLVDLLETRGSAGVPTSGDETSAVWTAKALSQFKSLAAPATQPLVRILEDESRPPIERQAALEALSQIGAAHADAVPAVIRLFTRSTHASSPALEQQRRRLRELAAESLAVAGPEARAAIPHLMRALRDRHEPVRRKSAAALGAMGASADLAVQALIDCMGGDESPAVRDAAQEALGRIGPAVLPALEQLWDYNEAELRARMIEIMAVLGQAAQSWTERFDLALDDPDPRVRLAAAEALWAINQDAAGIVPALVDELTNPDRQHRMRAFRLLTALGAEAQFATGPLRRMLDSPQPHVRRAAAEALRKLENQSRGAP